MPCPASDLKNGPADLKNTLSELLVATADGADELLDGAVPTVLKLLRQHMNMDVVFVSEFVGGQRVFRYVDTVPGVDVIAEGQSDPLEASWCQRVVDGRLPQLIENAALLPADVAPRAGFPIGSHLSTPVVLANGIVYGTLCCFSFSTQPGLTERDLKKLQYTAKLTAARIDRAAVRRDEDPT